MPPPIARSRSSASRLAPGCPPFPRTRTRSSGPSTVRCTLCESEPLAMCRPRRLRRTRSRTPRPATSSGAPSRSPHPPGEARPSSSRYPKARLCLFLVGRFEPSRSFPKLLRFPTNSKQSRVLQQNCRSVAEGRRRTRWRRVGRGGAGFLAASSLRGGGRSSTDAHRFDRRDLAHGTKGTNWRTLRRWKRAGPTSAT